MFGEIPVLHPWQILAALHNRAMAFVHWPPQDTERCYFAG
jgi:hypothetical protein